MPVNANSRQLDIAHELAEVARILAHSTHAIPRPSDTYELLGVLTDVQAALGQVYAHLGAWHGAAQDGRHFDGKNEGDTTGLLAAGALGTGSVSLMTATANAMAAANLVLKAHNANGAVRWFDEVRQGETASQST
jgi:hypothetical protein